MESIRSNQGGGNDHPLIDKHNDRLMWDEQFVEFGNPKIKK